MRFSQKDGKLMVNIARSIIAGREINVEIPDSFKESFGVFVTLKTYPNMDLRGCIGFPEPIFSLINALKKSAYSSAYEDPRFPPLQKKEINNIIIEITILNEPKLISDPLKEVKIGRDGLIVECGFAKGLLLPQVPVEFGWDVEEFLSHTCLKAGLSPNCWKNKNCKIYTFQAQIFQETKPGGNVKEIFL